jgi:hypothetical protein
MSTTDVDSAQQSQCGAKFSRLLPPQKCSRLSGRVSYPGETDDLVGFLESVARSRRSE